MKTTIAGLVCAVLLTMTGSAFAGISWKCMNGTTKEPHCYVTSVQWINNFSGSEDGKILYITYVNKTNQQRGYLQLKIGNFYATYDSIRAVESMALTAMTSGLPFGYYGNWTTTGINPVLETAVLYIFVVGRPATPVYPSF